MFSNLFYRPDSARHSDLYPKEEDHSDYPYFQDPIGELKLSSGIYSQKQTDTVVYLAKELKFGEFKFTEITKKYTQNQNLLSRCTNTISYSHRYITKAEAGKFPEAIARMRCSATKAPNPGDAKLFNFA